MGFMAVPKNREQLQRYIATGIVYSGIVDTQTIMIGGVCMVWDHVGFAWVMTSRLVNKYRIFFHKSCKEIIETGIRTFKLHRLETTIIEGHTVSKEWAERLGFKNETPHGMKRYDSDGNTYYLYAKIAT
jgi:hypothetical protein